jgi:tetratricopeptide (TPR) repeat protein
MSAKSMTLALVVTLSIAWSTAHAQSTGARPKKQRSSAASADGKRAKAAKIDAMARSKSSESRARALKTASKTLSKKRLMRLITRAIGDRSAVVRRAAAEALGKLDDKAARALLRKLVKDSDRLVRTKAMLALSRSSAKRAARASSKRKGASTPLSRKPASKRYALYKKLIIGAQIDSMQGRHQRALRKLSRARRVLDMPLTAYEVAVVHLKLGLEAGRAKRYPDAKRWLRRAARSFREYLTRAPEGKQARQARFGLLQVRRQRLFLRSK